MAKKKKKKDRPTAPAEGSGGSPSEASAAVPPELPAAVWKRRLIFCAVALAGTVFDILTKAWAFSALGVRVGKVKGIPVVEHSEVLHVVGNTLRFEGAVNTGAVFSLFRGQWFFLVMFTLIALAIIGWVLFRSKNANRALVAGLGLVCAGALGNLWDRVLFGCVRDFIVFQSSLLEPVLEGGRWPTFNVADVWICVGIPVILAPA
ncbi:MAG: signal peptidase II [Planctomycetota bacterium]|jgi:signal peptidase II